MKLLALDTATSTCSVALSLDGQITETSLDAPRVQAEVLLPMLDKLLADAGVRLTGLDAIAFGRGPGAFTGLRVAASVAQGLAYGAGLSVIPVSNLAALAACARRIHGEERVLACLDARMAEVYWAAFHTEAESVQALTEEHLTTAAGLMPPSPGPWFGAGSGWGVYAAALQKQAPGLVGMDGALSPSAGDIARLAGLAFRRGDISHPQAAQPAYIRDKVAMPRL